MSKINIYTVLLIGIILLGSYLRLVNFPNRYSLGEETVRDAVFGIESARELQLPLTGSFSSLGPFTFGPLYAYQVAFATLFLRTLYSPWIYLTFISILYIFVLYKIGENLYGRSFGSMLALFAALSPAQIISATHLTSHNTTNIFAALAILISLRLLRKNISYKWGFLLGIVLGTGMNLHYQMTGLIILPLLIAFYKRTFRHILYVFFGIFITFLPLLFFELNNHWFNTRNMLYYFFHGRYAMYIPNRWLFYVRDFWPAFWADALGTPIWVAVGAIVLFIIVLIWQIRTKKLSISMIFLLIAFLCNFILLRYYWGPRFFGYLNFLRPFVFIFTGYGLYVLATIKYGKYVATFFLLGTFLLAFPRIQQQLTPDPFSLKIYKEVRAVENKYPDKKFTLYGCSNVYRGSYDAKTFSTVFILELDNKIDVNGYKIGLMSIDCKYSTSESIFPELNNIGILDFSKASSSALMNLGWKQVSFKSIYESNARWWFKEQP